MRPGDIHTLRGMPNRKVLILSRPLPLYGTEEVEIAPIVSVPYDYQSDHDVRIDTDCLGAAFVCLWNSRLVPVSVVGPVVGAIDDRARTYISQIRRADAIGARPDIPADVVGPPLVSGDQRAAYQREEARRWDELIQDMNGIFISVRFSSHDVFARSSSGSSVFPATGSGRHVQFVAEAFEGFGEFLRATEDCFVQRGDEPEPLSAIA